MDLSILIVHTFEKRLVRQTLRSLRRAAPRLHVEVIVIDNNPEAGMVDVLRREFPETRYIAMSANRGFGAAMNAGIAIAKGRYILVFNPDIVVAPGCLEELYAYMEANPEVGIVGPRLNNPDGSLQYSCYRFHEPMIPVYRRTPLGKLAAGAAAIDRFLMKDYDHAAARDVDWVMGSAMFTRKSALEKVGVFDDAIFMYFEDTDLCRRFWESGFRVVYNPNVSMVHYHRRASSDGSLVQQLCSRMTRHHIRSAIYYFRKYYGKPNPRTPSRPPHEWGGTTETPAA
ncbi:glycosyltransferase family 2 protein [Candidatus Uhrbacteria bacterium]|nr:glycosyltransferase family 2 protein [Candidatus Uhrbacteria bacterium]